MGKISLSILTVTLALALVTPNVSPLDCSAVVEQLQEGLLNWLGTVSFIVPVTTTPAGWLLTMSFDQNFTGVGVWTVWVQYNGTERWARITNRDNNAELKYGDEFAFNFRVNYPILENGTKFKPQVASLNFQGIELCK